MLMEFWEEQIREILRQLKILCCSKCEPVSDWDIRCEERSVGEDELNTPGVVWYESRLVLPQVQEGQSLEFHLDTGVKGEWEEENPQFEFYVNGEICQGIDRNHRNVLLEQEKWKNREITISLRGYEKPLKLQEEFRSYVRVLEKRVEQYYYDIYVPFEVMCLLEKEDTTYTILLECLQESVKRLDLRKPYSNAFYESIEKADLYIEKELYEKYGGHYTEEVFCVGHTHIDVAWLWTLGVTRRKSVRSFSTVLNLMKQYPEYTFMSSQPQLYQFVKEEAPKLYEQIRARVAEGRWEPEGGMFVEADCNLTGGEALVRQFLAGIRFFREEFGKDCEILWLPDVFGYSAALPQIMKECNIRYFMTTKINWNDTNKLPYDTFYWKGIDGTKVLTHFVPTRDYSSASRKPVTNREHTTSFSTNYNGDILPSQIKGGWQRYQQKNLNRQVLNSFGYGDGGGGPTKEMLEIQRRLEKAIPGCPKTKMATAGQFFHRLEEEAKGKKIPVWSGELYLEYHRATYTSMAKNKRLNRYSEFLLQNLEMLGIYSGEYPAEVLKQAWEVVLRNQFHDILPGSSIEEVYRDSWIEYGKMLPEVEKAMEAAFGKVAERYQIPKGSLVIYNFNGTEESGLVALGEEQWNQLLPAVKQGVSQLCDDGAVRIAVSGIPAKGFVNITERNSDETVENMVQFSEECVENSFYRLKLNKQGQFASFYDKRVNREILKEGMCGNVLMTFEDKPFQFDNWNLEHYYTEKFWEVTELTQKEITETGPLRYSIRLTYQYLDSVIVETLRFYPDSSRIDLDFAIDWKEDQLFLKLLFPLELNTNEASFDIQYGNVTRSTARNTSWDCARFEVCCQKWMDVSEEGYGVSFLNDCKYGVSVEENVVGISLIKCGTYPNPKADRGRHVFSIAMYPHLWRWQEADTVREAYRFNNPLRGVVSAAETSGEKPEVLPVIQTDASNVIVETVKRAEDGGSLILRLYECKNRYTNVSCKLHPKIQKAWECNMLEEDKEELPVKENGFRFVMKPYEIKTLRLYV